MGDLPENASDIIQYQNYLIKVKSLYNQPRAQWLV
jgi:hypothetical protein